MSVGVICTAGLTAMLAAQIAGEEFQPNVVSISSTVMACTGAETVMPNIVFTAPSSMVTQLSLSSGTVRTILAMDTTVGNFTIGTMGLFTASGLLFALAAFPGAGTKIQNNLPVQVGNIRTLYMDTSYADISATFAAEADAISTVTIASILASFNNAITARQLRTALNNMGLLQNVISSILAAEAINPAVIDWYTCAPTTMGSNLLNFIAAATNQTDNGASILSTAALLPA